MKEKLKKYGIWFFRSFIWLGILVLALDIVTKLVVQANVAQGAEIFLIPNFLYVTLTYNLGMAWGLLSGQTGRIVLAVISWVASVAIIAFYIWKFKKLRLLTKAVTLVILAGCIGNLIDRTFYPSGVIDWIGFRFGSYNFPVFNLADAALVIGLIIVIVLMIIDAVKEFKEKSKKEKEEVANDINKVSTNETSSAVAPSKPKKERIVVLSKDEIEAREREKKKNESK